MGSPGEKKNTTEEAQETSWGVRVRAEVGRMGTPGTGRAREGRFQPPPSPRRWAENDKRWAL